MGSLIIQLLQSGVDEGVRGVDCFYNIISLNTVLLSSDGKADDVDLSSAGDGEGDVHGVR